MPTHRLLSLAAVAAIAVTGLTACGGSTPATTVTETHTQTRTRTVEKTPQACLDALDRADAAIGIAGTGFSIAADALTHVGNLDVDGLDTDTQKLNDLQPKLQGALDAYTAARDECRNGKQL